MLYRLRLVQTPNLNGVWTARLSSSLDEYQKEFEATVYIHQTWSRISLCYETEDLLGESLMASFRVITEDRVMLNYEYRSKKKPEFSNEEFMHHGLSHIMIPVVNGVVTDKLSGDYYTDRSRQSYGKIILIRKIASNNAR